MRPLALLAGLSLAACVGAAPKPLCACQPIRAPGPPPMVYPLPLMDDAGFAAHVASMIGTVCAAPADVGDGWGRRAAAATKGLSPSGEDAFTLRMRTSTVLVEPPTAARNTCRLTVSGPGARLVAVDSGLKDWAREQPMTWNIRDFPSGVTPGVNNTRVRGMTERGEAHLRWEYVPAEDAATPTELRAEWTPPGAD